MHISMIFALLVCDILIIIISKIPTGKDVFVAQEQRLPVSALQRQEDTQERSPVHQRTHTQLMCTSSERILAFISPQISWTPWKRNDNHT